jgi:hypothetical protein
MGRYFQNILCGDTLIRDYEGDELADVPAARRLALEVLFDMAREPAVYGTAESLRDRKFIITDETGRHVLTVPYSAVL